MHYRAISLVDAAGAELKALSVTSNSPCTIANDVACIQKLKFAAACLPPSAMTARAASLVPVLAQDTNLRRCDFGRNPCHAGLAEQSFGLIAVQQFSRCSGAEQVWPDRPGWSSIARRAERRADCASSASRASSADAMMVPRWVGSRLSAPRNVTADIGSPAPRSRAQFDQCLRVVRLELENRSKCLYGFCGSPPTLVQLPETHSGRHVIWVGSENLFKGSQRVVAKVLVAIFSGERNPEVEVAGAAFAAASSAARVPAESPRRRQTCASSTNALTWRGWASMITQDCLGLGEACRAPADHGPVRPGYRGCTDQPPLPPKAAIASAWSPRRRLTCPRSINAPIWCGSASSTLPSTASASLRRPSARRSRASSTWIFCC